MKLELDERTLNAYINRAINEEIDEGWFTNNRSDSVWWDPGTWGRTSANEKWGYKWDPNKSEEENIKAREAQRGNIKSQGYDNYEEYKLGTEDDEGDEEEFGNWGADDDQGYYGQEYGGQQGYNQGYPQEYPYKNNKQKTGQFQTWFNQNMGGHLVVDGIWGPRTEAAYQQWVSRANSRLNENKNRRYLSEKAFKQLVKQTIAESFR